MASPGYRRLIAEIISIRGAVARSKALSPAVPVAATAVPVSIESNREREEAAVAEEAAMAMEKGCAPTVEEGRMMEAEMAARAEARTKAPRVHSAKSSAVHGKSAAMHAAETTAAMHDQSKGALRFAASCYGVIHRADLSSIGWNRKRERRRSCKNSSFDRHKLTP
jgi:hypothetical protein